MSVLEIRRNGDSVYTQQSCEAGWDQSPKAFRNHGLNIDQILNLGAGSFIKPCISHAAQDEASFRHVLTGAINGFRCAQGAVYLAEVRGERICEPLCLSLFIEAAVRNPAVEEWMQGPLASLVPALFMRKSARKSFRAPVDRVDWALLSSSLNAVSRNLEARWLAEGLNRLLMGISPSVVDTRQ